VCSSTHSLIPPFYFSSLSLSLCASTVHNPSVTDSPLYFSSLSLSLYAHWFPPFYLLSLSLCFHPGIIPWLCYGNRSLFFRGEWIGWVDPGTGKQGRDCFLMGKFRDFVIREFFWFVWLQRWTSQMWRGKKKKKTMSWKKYAFYGLLAEFGFCELAECDEVRWRRKLCHGKNVTGNRFIMVCLVYVNSIEKNTDLFGTDTAN